MWFQSKFCMARYLQVLWAQQTLRWSQSGCSERLEVWGVVDSLSKCDAGGVGGGEGSAHGVPDGALWISCRQPQHQLCTQSVLDIPNAQFTPTQLLPCLSCGAVQKLATYRFGVAGDDDVEDLLGDEEVERVFESIGEAEDSGRL